MLQTEGQKLSEFELAYDPTDREFPLTGYRSVTCIDPHGFWWTGWQKRGQSINDVLWKMTFAGTVRNQKVNPVF